MIRSRPLLAAPACVLLLALSPLTTAQAPGGFQPVKAPAWVKRVTRMAFCTPGEVQQALDAGAQVIHFNLVWPYYPLRRGGGGLPTADAARLREFVEKCRKGGAKAVLGLPPFVPVALAKAHPEWRVHPDDTGSALRLTPEEGNLGTRTGCNAGPWGDYLIAVCAELVKDYGLDGFSFDGNYHAPLCFCPACKAAYLRKTGRPIPRRWTSTPWTTAATSSGAGRNWRPTSGSCRPPSRA